MMDGSTRETEAKTSAQPADHLELRGYNQTQIKDTVVTRGSSTEFKVMNGRTYVLIPDTHLTYIKNGVEVKATNGILAFEVDREGVILKVPADYPPSKENTVIRYSVLCLDKGATTAATYYAEGGSPPDVVIPTYP